MSVLSYYICGIGLSAFAGSVVMIVAGDSAEEKLGLKLLLGCGAWPLILVWLAIDRWRL